MYEIGQKVRVRLHAPGPGGPYPKDSIAAVEQYNRNFTRMVDGTVSRVSPLTINLKVTEDNLDDWLYVDGSDDWLYVDGSDEPPKVGDEFEADWLNEEDIEPLPLSPAQERAKQEREEREQERRDELKRIRKSVLADLQEARKLGVSADDLYQEVAEEERKQAIARDQQRFKMALSSFKRGFAELARAYESEHIPPDTLAGPGWPEWLPSIEEASADVQKMEVEFE